MDTLTQLGCIKAASKNFTSEQGKEVYKTALQLMDDLRSEPRIEHHSSIQNFIDKNKNLLPVAVQEMRARKVITATGKNFNTMYNIGKVKYIINYHDGISTHKDGSPFFGIHCESSKLRHLAKIKELVTQNYKQTN